MVWNRIKQVLDDRRGVSIILLAASIIPIMGMLGLAVDLGRGYMLKSQLSHALDAAGLAGGRVVFSNHLEEDIEMFFEANMPSGFMNASVDGPHFEVKQNNEIIELEASATIGTTFMRVLGIDTMTVSAFTEVTRLTQLLDVVLSIDMSTSMTWSDGSGGTRIAAARTAAKDLVDILFGDQEQKDLLNIAIVPWAGKTHVALNDVNYSSSTAVSVPSFTNPITGASQSTLYYPNNAPTVPMLSPPDSSWKGCVYARYLHDGNPDNDADLYYGQVVRDGKEWMGWQPIGPEGEPVSGSDRCANWVSGDGTSDCRPCIDHGVTTFTNVKQTVKDAIDDLTNPSGTTNIIGGLSWAWRVLKPEPPFTEADPDPEFPRQQAIILLTDGEHQGGSGDAYNAVFGISTSAGAGGMDARLTELAERVKDENVFIYVIQFYYENGPLAAMLKEVATSPDSPYYNFAPDGDSLRQIFREVASHLSQLRLSK